VFTRIALRAAAAVVSSLLAVQKENISIAASTGRVEFLLDALTALLMTFAAALVLIQVSARYGIPEDQLNFLVLSSN